MSEKKAFIASIVGFAANFILFVVKLVLGLLTNSLALISDAFNSFTDIFASVFIAWSIRISHRKPDADHPFGHSRAQPLAAFVVSILMFLVAFDVLQTALMRFFREVDVNFSKYAVLALIFSMLVKSSMYFYFKRVSRLSGSCALKAAALDSRNDLFSSFIALLGVISIYWNLTGLDALMAVFIACLIAHGGYTVARENLGYLMGNAPDEKMINWCESQAIKIQGVKNVHDLLAHYVGESVHLEMHIEVDANLTTRQSHLIGKKVQEVLQSHSLISRVFLHIDPV